MNWKQISEQYPKAWEKFFAWAVERMDSATFNDDSLQIHDTAKCGTTLYRAGGYESAVDPFPTRDLYDFFDQEGIIISVNYNHEVNVFYFCITLDRVINTEPPAFLKNDTRPEAETSAFTKAFSILEERLSK